MAWSVVAGLKQIILMFFIPVRKLVSTTKLLKYKMPADNFILWRIVMSLVSKVITRLTCLFLQTRLRIKFDWFLSTCMWIQNSSNKLKGCTVIKQRHKYNLKAEEKKYAMACITVLLMVINHEPKIKGSYKIWITFHRKCSLHNISMHRMHFAMINYYMLLLHAKQLGIGGI